MTLPSLLNMLTSSMAWMGWTLSFLSDCWSFLSSPADRAGARLTFLRGVPLPLLVTTSRQNLGPLMQVVSTRSRRNQVLEQTYPGGEVG